MHIDDLKNPEYRKGRRKAAPGSKAEPVRRPAPSEQERRARFAVAAAQAAFGRFYWNQALHRSMERELEKSRRRRQEAKQAARRKPNGGR